MQKWATKSLVVVFVFYTRNLKCASKNNQKIKNIAQKTEFGEQTNTHKDCNQGQWW